MTDDAAGQVARRSVATLWARLLSHGAQYGLQLVLVRVLGAARAGSVLASMAGVGLLAVVGRVGQDRVGMRAVAHRLAEGDRPAAAAVARRALLTVVVSSGAVALLLAAGSGPIARWYEGVTGPDAVLAAALVIPGAALGATAAELLRAAGRPAWSVTAVSTAPLVLTLATLLGIAALDELSVSAGLLAHAVGFGAAAAVAGLGVLRLLGPPSPERPETSDAERGGGFLLAAALIVVVLSSADVLVVGELLPGRDTAAYVVLLKLGQVVGLGMGIVTVVVVPAVAGAHWTDRSSSHRTTAQSAVRWGYAAAVLASALIVSWGPPILAAFDPGFRGEWPLLCVVVLAQLLGASVGPVGEILLATGKERAFTVVVGTVAVGVVAGLLLGTPRFGLPGAVWTTALGLLAWRFASAVLVWRHLQLRPAWASVVVGIVVVGAAALLRSVTSGSAPAVAATLAAAVAVYYGVCSAEDRRLLRARLGR